MRIVIIPSGFKESLNAERAAHCIEAGIKRVLPEASIKSLPMVDGGEGFAETLVRVTNGERVHLTVTGPVGDPIDATFGFLGGTGPRTAVLEMAAAAGLKHVPRDMRNPSLTTTYGVGEMIAAALDLGAERILLGCGDSGTSDGGVGMAQALGARLLNVQGDEISKRGAIGLLELNQIDLTHLDARLKRVRIDVACNWHNRLCGPKGVARVFGPQKGASPEQVNELEVALERYANVIERDTGFDVRQAPGCGASGGLGAGLKALLGAKLHSRYDIISQYMKIDEMLQQCDLVFTAEGSIDYQTPHGKIPSEVASKAKRRGIPVFAFAGTIGKDARVNYECGIDAYTSILQAPSTLEEAILLAEELLTDSSESAMRTILLGYRLGANSINEGHAS
ncbi:glycerate kinase [Paenibacillus sp. GSMTC-2017]|uniref:glycerate kinase family protein n=1 Tax=Paenibacillus sp. GSMTC-2017 TaxID=2794350 RepID=UPI0018D5BA1C|nr:glycerate kinase [Paenibacillus sp. GSMTC-2017]MBH5316259.1 glycerate kinase [Paenibacillus sp. GSMTC-2017]